jgi:UDP-N-acetylglucosamine--N-acetylmuramyl-(pentapeptide) pyrophosphoryl-undecaprenol N-acetylglucosamine transferase
MKRKGDYVPYAFIYAEMPSVLKAADIVLSRSGANSIWECAVCRKPMLLVPLSGSGTRGDQVDNARFFERAGEALVLAGEEVDSAHLKTSLEGLLDGGRRAKMSDAAGTITGNARPSLQIANILLNGVFDGSASNN